jgi:hypothetical protein
VIILAAGKCDLVANQAGNANLPAGLDQPTDHNPAAVELRRMASLMLIRPNPEITP